MAEDAGDPDGQQEEEPDGEHERERDRASPCGARDLLVLLFELSVRGDAERLEPDLERLDESDDAAHERQPQEAVALEPGDERERLDVDLPVLLAHGHRPGGHAAHHHALEHCLAADWSVPNRPERLRRRRVGPTVRLHGGAKRGFAHASMLIGPLGGVLKRSLRKWPGRRPR